MSQINSIRPPPQCGFLNLEQWFLAGYRRGRKWDSVRKDESGANDGGV